MKVKINIEENIYYDNPVLKVVVYKNNSEGDLLATNCCNLLDLDKLNHAHEYIINIIETSINACMKRMINNLS